MPTPSPDRARPDVGGIECRQTPRGRRVLCDVDADSNRRPQPAAASALDPFERVVDWLHEQLRGC